MGLEQSQTQVEEGNGTSGPHMNQFFNGSSNKSWSSCDENWCNSPRRSVVSLGTYLTGINSSAEPNHSIRSEIKVPRENQCPLSTTLISHPPLVLTFISPWKGFCLLRIMCHSSLGSWNFSQVQVIAELCQMPHALHQVAGKTAVPGWKRRNCGAGIHQHSHAGSRLRLEYWCLTQSAGGLRWSTAAKIPVSPFNCSQGC